MIFNSLYKWFLVILIGVALGFAATTVSAAQSERRQRDGDRSGPPPERADVAQPRFDQRRRPRPHALTRQQIEEALDVVDRIDPQMARRLRNRYADAPEDVGRALQERLPRIFRFMQLRRDDPILFEMRVDEIKLASHTSELSIEYQHARTNGDQKQTQALEQRLTKLITERFELQQAIREHEIDRLQRRIDALLEQLEEHESSKDKMIARRLEQITGRNQED